MPGPHFIDRTAIFLVVPVLLCGIGFECEASGAESNAESAAERGYRILRNKAFLPADFDNEIFESLWKVWPEPLRSEAQRATPEERRRMTFSRYGLIEDPDDPTGSGAALGYLDNGRGGWVMNCLACHGGKVAGQVIPGLPNTHTALQTLTEDVSRVKVMQLKKFTHLDLASLKLPLSTTNGTTNSVIFGVVLGALRDAEMRVDRTRPIPELIHHDMDAPPFWNVRKKSSLYADGFSPKSHRPLMQFILIPSTGPEQLQAWEDDFRDILAWIESVEPPPYPWEIDKDLAARGERLFRKHCAECHGTYGKDGEYRQQIVSIDIVGTDPVRLNALSPEHRAWMKEGWLSHYGEKQVLTDPGGYVAPPLDGIWATAPYLHNGSVPTLWHLFYPNERPVVWKRTEDGYDRARIGLEVEQFEEVPETARTPAQRREYFDTRLPGKSARGHDFPEVLSDEEKRAVLEYLKTL